MSAGAPSTAPPVLDLQGVGIGYRGAHGWTEAVRDVTLRVRRGETYGLVGESGSGKSTLALAIMRFLPANGRLSSGSIRLAGDDLYALPEADMQRVWRDRVKFVPQNPLPSLNPSHPVGAQLREVLAARRADDVAGRALELLASVGLADPERVAAAFPHQLSGGMQQRVMIAMALAGEPELLVLDEPTTNLDVTTEANILDLVRDLIRERGTAVLYVSHSLGVVAQVCDRVAVLYAGEVVEDAPVGELYARPLHPYAQGLLDSVPRVGQRRNTVTLRPIPGRIPAPGALPPGCLFAPRCPLAIGACRSQHPPLERAGGDARQVRCIRWQGVASGELDPRQPPPPGPHPPGSHPAADPTGPGGAPDAAPDTPGGAPGDVALTVDDLRKRFALPRSLAALLARRPRRQVRAVDGVSLRVGRGTTLGLVGESGSGKSTLARAVIGLEPASDGTMTLLDVPLARRLSQRDRGVIRQLQMVFQSSEEALNPYRTVGQTLRRPFRRLAGLSREEADLRVGELLSRVQLDPGYAARLPEQLSGGERQRVAIARAFASQPELLLFDESVSGLDVSVQAAILNLLSELQREHRSAYLFISHDLAVVAYLADAIAVIYLGQLMEVGSTAAVLEPPYHPYTEALLSSIPLIDPHARRATIRLQGEVPSPVDVPSGCRFHTRCPRFLGDICVQQTPPWREDERGLRIHCHIPLDELSAAQEPIFRPQSAPPDRAAPAPLAPDPLAPDPATPEPGGGARPAAPGAEAEEGAPRDG